MKKIILVLVAISAILSAQAQTINSEIADKLSLKELVDTFSVLADQKETDAQTFLFTEDATVESYQNGVKGSSYTGRQAIGDAFGSYLALFKTVYHLNGQQVVKINGDKATGTAYCTVVLVGERDGKTMKTQSNVIYQDEYTRVNGKWLISNRKSNFVFSEVTEVK